MKINRITYSIKKNELREEQLKDFNILTSFYEELIFNFLPKNTEVGGYGFLDIKFELDADIPSVRIYGQIIEAFRPISQSELKSYLNCTTEEKIVFLGNHLKGVLSDVRKQMNVDFQIFEEANLKAKENYNGFEQELNVSKNHKSGKLKVSICRVIRPEDEFIQCRIVMKSGEILDKFDLMKNSSIYDSSHDFKKSRWKENSLVIFNRFNEEKISIDVSKYLN
ncbi:hypothetical protein MM213_20345 [Belliella sp. R4-6]|uniref:Uncharacterized protein n=1 Tax=Belliella alkalica TaxID=1730871 RepID=A0ABS9VHE1_9BACT|nr:hypothetical protein [Belliella alkalica]MCH7415862.1 hypothetical protein [Belliella alkalica]